MKQGSFTQQVKDEICLNNDFTKEELIPLLSGYIKTNGNLSFSNNGESLTLQTENSKIAKLLFRAFRQVFNVSSKFTYSRKMKLDKCVVYNITIEEKVEEILQELQIMDGFERLSPKEIIKNEGIRFYITGVFLASGSVNSPKSNNYHLQLVVSEEEDAKFLIRQLNKFKNEKNMDFKYITRRNKQVVYLKKADQITVFLALVNAPLSMLEFENVRVEKDCINSENRYQICLTANYQKTLANSLKQIEDIKLIDNKIGIHNLECKMQYVSQIRLDNPEAPLSLVASLLEKEYDVKISKSAVSRLFSNIHELAEGYRKEK